MAAQENTELEVEEAQAAPRKHSGLIKWLLIAVAALALLFIAALALLNTSLGERFLADRIAANTLPNGLNIQIGRIEGDIYGKAILHDVTLSDPEGIFATIPEAEIDWNPSAWLSYRLEIDEFVARRGRVERVPEFLASEDDGPILPGFDIAIERLVIDGLTLSPAVTGADAEELNLTAKAVVEDKRLVLDGSGTLGAEDRFALSLNAEPDGDVFDAGLDYQAPAGGAVAKMLGAQAGYDAKLIGDGRWSDWSGALLIRRDGARFAAFTLANKDGLFEVLGQASPAGTVSGTLAEVLGQSVSLKARARIAERQIDGDYTLVTRGGFARGQGLVSLADNSVEDFTLSMRSRTPDAFGEALRLRNARLDATIDGGFDDLEVDHRFASDQLDVGAMQLFALEQNGTASYDGDSWRLPLNVEAARIASGLDMVDDQLEQGRLTGDLRLNGGDLTSSNLQLTFPTANAALAMRADLSRGLYGFSGDVSAQGLAFENVGQVSGTAQITLGLGQNWTLRSVIDARLTPASDSAVQTIAGGVVRVRGPVAMGTGAPIAFSRLRVDAPNLAGEFGGQVRGGQTILSGGGSHQQYGPFTLEASLSEEGPEARLVLARPLPAAGLRNVELALAPSDAGLQLEAKGGSLLGPFNGLLGITNSAGGTQINVERLIVTDTEFSGELALLDGGLDGELAFDGGGASGAIALSPRQIGQDSGQGFALNLAARGANFGGDTPIRIAQADVSVDGVMADGLSELNGTASGQGLSYGTLFIGRFAGEGQVRNGKGQVNGSLAGRRGGSFRLDLTSDFDEDRVAFAAKGEFSGRRISMPRRAVLSRLDDGSWRLQRSQINFGRGAMIASGAYGEGQTALTLDLRDMPLSLVDLAVSELGLGGSISGQITYRNAPGSEPVGSVRVKVDDLSRAGLVLSSRPVDLALTADLNGAGLGLRARFANADIERGALSARIDNLPTNGLLWDRLRTGRLAGRLRYDGAAESLWRLAGVESFDLTGPVAIAADASGSVANPRVRGTVNSDNLRVRSALSGTDIREISARGQFDGSRLRLTRFAGVTPNGGSISGSGTVDLAELGERVPGRFVEIRGPQLDLRAAAKNAKLLDGNGLSATITGPLRIVSNGLGGTIAGRVQINRASWKLGAAADDVSLPRIATREVNAPNDRPLRTLGRRPWRYLIDAKGRSRIDVDGLGLDSEWGADIILRGTTEDPRIGGEANVVRGSYSFAGTRFELTRGRIRFDESVAIDPRLDIRAETDQAGFDVEVRVSGNALQPEVSFSSDPALPEEEILAQLLFGGSITNLSATDALQLGSALASLRGGGGLDPINRLRSAIGLDRLRVVGADPALDRGTSVALGKNIGRRFYVELITDGRGYSATEAEFRITSWLSLLGAVSTIGRNSAVIEARRNY
ncbi:translocation/assembly module TamB domain-containing protein [Qipengyuania sp. DGS5-3]|uniref:translocation/assembly module TamB domain-containing protein n=1 Tax=Qipengyuania sp. DGS5-3 TaxID=3349632 RepID=UPI0036D232C7